mgnify:CR=1 FL=1
MPEPKEDPFTLDKLLPLVVSHLETPDEMLIRTLLGLKDPKEHAAWAITHNLKNRDRIGKGFCHEDALRGAGSTTRMLIRALVEVMAGKQVFVIARDPGFTEDLQQRAKDMAQRLGLKASLILRGRKCPSGVLPFQDHYHGR